MAGPWEKYGQRGVAITAPNPKLPWELKSAEGQAQAAPYAAPRAKGEVVGQTIHNTKDAATLPYDVTKAKSEAQSAQIKAQSDQIDFKNKLGQIPGDPNLQGQAYLKSLPPGMADKVIAMDQGRLGTPINMRNPEQNQLAGAATHYDPSFDATKFNTRLAAMKNRATGGMGNTVNALNTAIGHAGLLYDQSAGPAGHNVPFAPWLGKAINSVQNAWNDGSPAVTTYENTLGHLTPEEASAYKIGTGAERGGLGETMSINNPLETKRDVIHNALELFASKEAAQLAQFNWGNMGNAKPSADLLDPDAYATLKRIAPDLLQKHFSMGRDPMAVTLGMPQFDAGDLGGGGGNNAPPVVHPGGGGGPPNTPGGANYSSLVGATGGSNVATGGYRNVYDPTVAGALSAFIKKGAPYETVAAYMGSHGFNPPNPKDYAAAISYQKTYPNTTPNVEADKSVPTSVGERLSASPAAALTMGALSGGTAGLDDVVGRSMIGDAWDANRQALTNLHPTADMAGNLIGGAAAGYGAGVAGDALQLGARARLALGAQRAAQLGKVAPMIGDAAYGGIYGASENPSDPLQGAMLGAGTGVAAGIGGRKITGGLSNVISPDAGAFKPLYDAGVFPTPGQRFAKSGMFGRALNLTEQAMQSFPLLGAAPAAARQASRDGFQTGAFNKSLAELKPFNEQLASNTVGSALPSNVGPGTDAHAFATRQFDKAYDIARSGMQFQRDPQFIADEANFGQTLNNGVLSGDQASQVQKVIDNAVGSRLQNSGGTLNGDAYKSAASDLGTAIRTWGKNPSTAPMADALSNYQAAFDEAARRSSHPQSVGLLDAADKGYAQLVRIQRASELGGAAKDAGTFTPTNYAAAAKQMGGGVRSSAWNNGNALGQDYAQAGLNLSDKLADSGTPIRLATLGALQGGEGAALALTGHAGMFANPMTAVPFLPYMPGVRGLTNRMIAPNAQRLRALPRVAAGLDWAGQQLDNAAPMIGQGAIPAALTWQFNQ